MTSIRGLAAAVSLLLLSACGMTDPVAQSGSWVTVKEQTTCEALATAYCVGAFGFTVQNDGHFTVGPADDGSTVSGALTDSERARVSADASAFGADLTASPQCDPTRTVAGVSDLTALMSRHYPRPFPG